MARRLRAGDVVEVRSLPEILATLDGAGTLEAMPFMAEMAKYCGTRVRVAKRAHKTCNTVDNTGGARVPGAVHLDGLRCDGSAHGGCQASCLMFWKEAWLKPVREGEASAGRGLGEATTASSVAPLPAEWAYRDGQRAAEGPIKYRCQITEIPRFTTRLPWWDVRQYVEDMSSGNVGGRQFVRGIRFALLRAYLTHGIGYRLVKRAYTWLQRLRGGGPFFFVTGSLDKTPHRQLDLREGEWVRVKSFEDIIATLDTKSKNRGLGFDAREMRLHCDKAFQVKARVHKIVNEQTGEMMQFANPCITLEGVYCTGENTQNRLFCPRGITPYWREIWLERTSAPDAPSRPA